jgi:hypothetical protein
MQAEEPDCVGGDVIISNESSVREIPVDITC